MDPQNFREFISRYSGMLLSNDQDPEIDHESEQADHQKKLIDPEK